MHKPSTPAAAHAAPEPRTGLDRGWSVQVTFSLNAAVLTLLNPQGEQAHISFALGFAGGQPLTVTDLDEIRDAALRTAAESMLAAYAERVATVERAIAEFNRQLPPDVLARLDLDLAAQQITLEVDVDSDALALEVRLSAAGEAADVLLSLVNRWRRAPQASAGNIAEELADGAVWVRLPQDAGVHLLAWLARKTPARATPAHTITVTMQE
jgi:hypothetical protein